MLGQRRSSPIRWRFQAHPEVWLLVAFLIGAYVYIGARDRPAGRAGRPAGRHPPPTWCCFVGAMLLLWVGQRLADPRHRRGVPVLGAHGPAHDAQLLHAAAGPAGHARRGWLRPLRRRRPAVPAWCAGCAKPVVAGVLFNVAVMVTHIPRRRERVGRRAARCTTALHVLVVTTVAADVDAGVRPVPRAADRRCRRKMIYLFLQSVVPTVPGRLADVRRGRRLQDYDQPVRVWGISVDRRPAAGRGDHEGRRLDLPVGDRRLPVLQTLRLGVRATSHDYRRRGRVDADRRDRRPRRGPLTTPTSSGSSPAVPADARTPHLTASRPDRVAPGSVAAL